MSSHTEHDDITYMQQTKPLQDVTCKCHNTRKTDSVGLRQIENLEINTVNISADEIKPLNETLQSEKRVKK